jgi:hypothetical protein
MRDPLPMMSSSSVEFLNCKINLYRLEVESLLRVAYGEDQRRSTTDTETGQTVLHDATKVVFIFWEGEGARVLVKVVRHPVLNVIPLHFYVNVAVVSNRLQLIVR